MIDLAEITALQRLRLVATLALQGIEQLAPAERAEAYEGIALLLQEPQAAEARKAAFAIRECERQQAKFRDLLTPNPEGTAA